MVPSRPVATGDARSSAAARSALPTAGPDGASRCLPGQAARRAGGRYTLPAVTASFFLVSRIARKPPFGAPAGGAARRHGRPSGPSQPGARRATCGGRNSPPAACGHWRRACGRTGRPRCPSWTWRRRSWHGGTGAPWRAPGACCPGCAPGAARAGACGTTPGATSPPRWHGAARGLSWPRGHPAGGGGTSCDGGLPWELRTCGCWTAGRQCRGAGRGTGRAAAASAAGARTSRAGRDGRSCATACHVRGGRRQGAACRLRHRAHWHGPCQWPDGARGCAMCRPCHRGLARGPCHVLCHRALCHPWHGRPWHGRRRACRPGMCHPDGDGMCHPRAASACHWHVAGTCHRGDRPAGACHRRRVPAVRHGARLRHPSRACHPGLCRHGARVLAWHRLAPGGTARHGPPARRAACARGARH